MFENGLKTMTVHVPMKIPDSTAKPVKLKRRSYKREEVVDKGRKWTFGKILNVGVLLLIIDEIASDDYILLVILNSYNYGSMDNILYFQEYMLIW